MNLVEATVDGDDVPLRPVPGCRSAPGAARPDGPVILGIRPESFEDAAFAPGLPTIEVQVEVLEDLGSDAHVFFQVDARRSPPRCSRPRRGRSAARRQRALFTARVDARTTAASAAGSSSRSIRARLHFFDPRRARAWPACQRPPS